MCKITVLSSKIYKVLQFMYSFFVIIICTFLHCEKTLARESLVSDIPAGDGKNDNLFLTVYEVVHCTLP